MKKIQFNSESGSALEGRNSIRSHFEVIRESIRKTADFNSEYIEDTLFEIFEIITEIIGRNDIPREEKVRFLSRVHTETDVAVANLAKEAELKPLAYWEERRDRFVTPTEFVILNYPTYNQGLTQADIRKADFKLYSALHNQKRRSGWPDDFNLPTKSEQIDKTVSGLIKRPSLTDGSLTTVERKEQRRQYDALYRRQKK